MSLLNVYDLTGVTDKQLTTIHDIVEKRILVRLLAHGIDVSAVPKELEYVLDELIIRRFNRIGSEGFESEKTDSFSGGSVKYEKSDIAEFEQDFKAYAIKYGTKQGNKPNDKSRAGIFLII